MYRKNDIILAVDYHDGNFVVRQLDTATGEECLLKRPTTAENISRVVHDAGVLAEASGGRVIWVMESTTGWARVKDLLGSSAELVVANVLEMPLPPKARRKKTDKIDTKRLLREVVSGKLPVSFQPQRALRELKRIVALRESLVSRRTAVQNWVNRYLAHETWLSRDGLWSAVGMKRLRAFASTLTGLDAVTWSIKLDEWDSLASLIKRVEAELFAIHKDWPLAQRIDEIYGIAEISAVSILAQIGPITRFSNAERLIAFAGLAPGVQGSDNKLHYGRIGGGGTDKHLRHYIIEATIWARRIPRYQARYERVAAKRGKKIGRLVVGRLLLRSIYKMLRDDVRFDRVPQNRVVA
jgi:transposase